MGEHGGPSRRQKQVEIAVRPMRTPAQVGLTNYGLPPAKEVEKFIG